MRLGVHSATAAGGLRAMAKKPTPKPRLPSSDNPFVQAALNALAAKWTAWLTPEERGGWDK